ncbi:MAG: TerB family tellurite resistance protein [SAR324 cluster bacterium]|nr:TerB family tellurite resistance protein [SAR324 cluster bacterium]
MDINREQYLDILVLASHMARADGELHPSEKKVLTALFNSIDVTDDEQKLIRQKSSVEKMIQEVTSNDAKNALVDVLALVAGADGVFEDKEKDFITKIMKRVGMNPNEHPYFKAGGQLDIDKIKGNVKNIINNIKKLSH